MRRAAVLAPFVLAAAVASGACWGAAPPPLASPQSTPPPLTAADKTAIIAALADAQAQGLPATAPPRADASDQTWADAAIAYAKSENGFIADPAALDPNFALKPATDDAAEQFGAARDAGRIAQWIAGTARIEPAYLALVKARDGYAAILKAGGWQPIADGKAPRLGASDARTPSLRARLALEGYLSAPTEPSPLLAPLLRAVQDAGGAPPSQQAAPETQFDAPLAAALAKFQDHHGLKADGVLTAATLAALNVPAEARLAAIEANLERARWLPNQMPATRIEVDLGGPDATLFEAGAPVLTMRAIVGRPDRQTPIFVSKVLAVKFNPPWIVPADIAAAEILPKERASPGYLARNDYYLDGGQVIQRPGPKAALGYVKFEMPDPFGVYLHDTPARALFAHDRRWLSHGCMRLEKPRELAAAVLAPQGWDRTAVDAAIAAAATSSVSVKPQVPVFVVYRTAVASRDDHVTFRQDVYGWDAKIAVALAGR
jgi:murein L,D-transpeptidase YcbB/YkuD